MTKPLPAPTGRPPQTSPSDGLVDALVQSAFTTMAVLTRIAAEHDLSLTQLRVLAILRDHEPSMARLATHLGLERSSVSGLVDRAVRRGLVRREASAEDGRAVRVGLTEEGRALAVRLQDEVGVLLAPLVDHLDARDRSALARLLGDLLA